LDLLSLKLLHVSVPVRVDATQKNSS
jgi:hypothetical protein